MKHRFISGYMPKFDSRLQDNIDELNNHGHEIKDVKITTNYDNTNKLYCTALILYYEKCS